jgi:uncharacterized Zn finger protein (UPF0148 family)
LTRQDLTPALTIGGTAVTCSKCGYMMTDFDVVCPRCKRLEEEREREQKERKVLEAEQQALVLVRQQSHQEQHDLHEQWVAYVMGRAGCDRQKAEEALRTGGYGPQALQYAAAQPVRHGQQVHAMCPLCGGDVVRQFTKTGQVIPPWAVVLLFLFCLWPLIFLLFLNKPDRTFRECANCGHIWQVM